MTTERKTVDVIGGRISVYRAGRARRNEARPDTQWYDPSIGGVLIMGIGARQIDRCAWSCRVAPGNWRPRIALIAAIRRKVLLRAMHARRFTVTKQT